MECITKEFKRQLPLVLMVCMVISVGCDRIGISQAPNEARPADSGKDFWQTRAEQVYASVAAEKSDAGRQQILTYTRLLRDFYMGSPVEARGPNGETLLNAAVLNEDVQVVERLLSLNILAEINTQNDLGQTPLIIAVNNNYIKLVEALVKHGALVNQKDKRGLTPLMYAALNNNETIVKSLIKCGADVGLKNDDGKAAYQLTKSANIKALLHN